MKVMKMITLDENLIEQLKNDNASGLINDLLNQHYNLGEHNNLEQLEQKLKNQKIIVDKENNTFFKLQDYLNKLIDKEKKTKKMFKDIPKEILQDFKAFPDMNTKILMNRHANIYKKNHDIKLNKVLEAFKEFKKE